ncbi:hypothetical protein DPEC_G00364620 [Dallia pectoralis]|nr:hypothetical protein DPEC_G00364620 [Dallia pectoralis]
MSATLTEPGLDGNFRIPVEVQCDLRGAYIGPHEQYTCTAADSYGPKYAKHSFPEARTITKGHKRLPCLPHSIELPTERDSRLSQLARRHCRYSPERLLPCPRSTRAEQANPELCKAGRATASHSAIPQNAPLGDVVCCGQIDSDQVTPLHGATVNLKTDRPATGRV